MRSGVADRLGAAAADRGRAQSSGDGALARATVAARTCGSIVSPARRAQETALALGRSFETIEALAPGCDVATPLAAAGWPDGERTVLVVGHQPTLGETAARLVDGQESSWRIGTGAVWWLKRQAAQASR